MSINPPSIPYFGGLFIMAEIHQLPNGKWFARVPWTKNGVLKSKTKMTFRTKKEAEVWYWEHKNKVNQGIDINKNISFVKFYDRWVARYKEPKVSEVTMGHYKNVRKHLAAYFGDCQIKSIHTDDYQGFINAYGLKHAPASVKKLNSIVRACVKFAVFDDYIRKDFTYNVSLTANKDRTVKVDYPNLAEIKRLVDYLLSTLPSKRRYTSKYMILLAIYTGMRLSEIQALTWKDIDFKAGTIDINKSWYAKERQFKAVKNTSSKRIIRVNKSVLKIIETLKFGSASTLVFINQFGQVPTSNAVNKTLRKILSELNIHRQKFHFHSLRHSHVALLLADGVDIYAISKRLGHSNTTTTSEIYAYLIDEYKAKTDHQIVDVLSDL